MVLILTLGMLSGCGNNTENTSQSDTDTGKEIDLSCDCACLQETGHLSARREDLPKKVRRKGAT